MFSPVSLLSPRVSSRAIYSYLRWIIGIRILGRDQNFGPVFLASSIRAHAIGRQAEAWWWWNAIRVTI